MAPCTQNVAVVLIERVHRAGPELIGCPTGDVKDLAFPRDAVVRLKVVRVLEFEFRVCSEFREMK